MEPHENLPLSELLCIRQTKEFADPVARGIHTTGRSKPIDGLNEYSIFTSLFPNAGSYDITYLTGKKAIDEFALATFLENDGWERVKKYDNYDVEKQRGTVASSVWAKKPGYMISYECWSDKKNGRASSYYDLFIGEAGGNVGDGPTYCENVKIITSNHPNLQEDSEVQLNIIKDAVPEMLVSKSSSSKIGIISHDGSEYYVKKFSLEDRIPEFLFPDLHYGEGFNDFHNSLLKRIEKESKGLVLFHGFPGTGKTQYIRMLLDELSKIGKSILYAPPSLSSQLTEPIMIEFISNWVLDEEDDCILLIEDAEPLLEIRNGSDGRTTGISNLLNMTDGILNDLLGLMVIATFNTDINKIDPALLRPQRLIARKEFGKLTKERAEELSKAINITLPNIEYPASLAEFYSVKQESGILLHNVKEDNRKIGFR